MKKTFRLEGLCCANCAAKIERKINELEHVENCVINFMTTKMTIESEKEYMEEVVEKAKAIALKIEPDLEFVKA